MLNRSGDAEAKFMNALGNGYHLGVLEIPIRGRSSMLLMCGIDHAVYQVRIHIFELENQCHSLFIGMAFTNHPNTLATLFFCMKLIKKYFHGMATIGRITHKKTFVISSAGEPIHVPATQSGNATMNSQIVL